MSQVVDVALAEHASDKRCVGTLEDVVDIGRSGIGLELDEECVQVVLDVGPYIKPTTWAT